MSDLDPNRQRELEFLLSQGAAIWTGRRRLAVALALAVGIIATLALALIASGLWLWIVLGLALGLVAGLFGVLDPERWARLVVRLMPTHEAMRRGDKRRQNWPG